MLSSGDGLIVGNGSDLQLVALDDLTISRRDDWKKKSSMFVKTARYFEQRRKSLAPQKPNRRLLRTEKRVLETRYAPKDNQKGEHKNET